MSGLRDRGHPTESTALPGSGQKVVVVGLAESGVAAALALVGRGADVLVTEMRPRDQVAERARSIESARVQVTVGGHHPSHLDQADLVVTSPGVPEGAPILEWARERGIPVWSELEVGARLAHCPYVAVTGTNGKTTTTEMIAAAMQTQGLDAIACGNVGYPFSVAAGEDHQALSVEVSSFQLRFQESFHPEVSVLLNLAPDHLDWHGTFEQYAAAKARVFRNQRPDDVLVFNRDDEVASRLAESAPSRRVAFSIHEAGGAARLDGVSLTAPHDRANALAAANAALEVGATSDGIARALNKYPRLHHRVARVGNAGGVQYYDDSKATNPHATLSAVRAFESRDGQVVLVAGGRNKGLDLSVLRTLAPRLRAVVAIGEAAGDVEAAFTGGVPVTRADSMRAAVVAAASSAQPGDVVLLSPACASFDWYPSYAARGDEFAREVAQLGERGVA